MKFSRFQRLDHTTPEPEKQPVDWYKRAENEVYCLSLEQTRSELRAAIRYKQAWEFLWQEVESIASGRELPLMKERRLEACLKIVRKNWPDLS